MPYPISGPIPALQDDNMQIKPIGKIQSPFTEAKGTPIQPSGAKDAEGIVEIFPEYADGLLDLDGFSCVILLYHFHKAKETSLQVKPFLDTAFHGVFATRAPARPNPIGLSVVELTTVEENRLFVKGIDVISGTPLLDIKPYVPAFDQRNCPKTGWLEKNLEEHHRMKDDGRFAR